ncbi:MAG: flagellar assembly protein T N-terminal domain-containing protein [Elusimicrobia bacterium]|nr:flagellar assembly protein T N-terminal domain-containing protein [Elusimicrobiota bacterium]
MKRYTHILCVGFFALLVGGCSGARRSALNSAYETEVVEAEGQAPIVNGDAQGAKKTALHEAMKSALGLVVGIYVSQEAMVSKAVLIDDTITSQTEGYIEKYETLKEEKTGDSYKIRIRAHVRKEDISAKLKNLESEPQKLGNPVIGFEIKEVVDGKTQETDYAELELKNTFTNAGFMTGEKEKADVLIKGLVKSDFNTKEGLGGFISYRAGLSVDAVKQGSGETLAALQETTGGIDLNESAAARAAIINAARRAGEELKERVLKGLREKSVVRLSLSKVDGMNQLSDFLKSLRNIPMVRDCWLRSLTGNTAAIDVGLRKGNASDLSQLLMKNARFPVKINRTSSYDLEAELEAAAGK